MSRGVSSTAGLACEFRVDVDGKTVAREVIGRGDPLPREVDRVETLAYRTRTTWVGSDLTEKGHLRLAVLERVPTGAELNVSGQIWLNDSTSSPGLTVYIYR